MRAFRGKMPPQAVKLRRAVLAMGLHLPRQRHRLHSPTMPSKEVKSPNIEK